MRRPHFSRGFTLLELLVTISVIGLIATLAITALNNSRVRARDAKRLADLKQFHQAMELCADDNGGSYTTPTNCCSGITGANNNIFQCTNAAGNGIKQYLPQLDPDVKDPSTPTTDCNGLNNAACEYAFRATPASGGYTIYYYLERNGQNKLLTHRGLE